MWAEYVPERAACFEASKKASTSPENLQGISVILSSKLSQREGTRDYQETLIEVWAASGAYDARNLSH